VVDLLSMKAYLTNAGKTTVADIPAEAKDEAMEARTKLVESVAETDDVLVEKYLEGEEISDEQLVAAFKAAFAKGAIIPLFCGSAETLVGANALVDAFDQYFPSPLERAPYLDQNGESIAPDADGPLAAIVFKTFADPFTGQVSLVRVVRGTLHSDDTVFNACSETDERVGKIHLQQGKEQKAVDAAGPGEVVAIVKLKDTRTGHTLCSKASPVKLAGFAFAPSAISYAIEPKSKGDEEKIVSSVNKMAVEDPSITFQRDPATHEMLISGTGQNHIEITLQRIARKFKVEVLLKAPKVPYRETITKSAEAQGRHKKQTGGRGQFGDCWLRIKPLPRSAGFSFVNDIFGGSIPRNYIPAVEKGVVETMAKGWLAGYPIVDLECSVYDGSYHAVDSSDLAFKLAAAKGFKLALEKAGPVLLEPVMLVEVAAPDDVTGDIIGDLNSRRGKVLNMEAKGHSQVIKAEVPLAEMLTYAPSLRSMTADRGSYIMEFIRYDEVPAHIAEKVIAAAKREDTEEEED
ncbi:MAG TPA: elongation factor G, partial [Oligoflexia bacterium]|nr:elongation factor G [Oligoflexia bacterium]